MICYTIGFLFVHVTRLADVELGLQEATSGLVAERLLDLC
jgi:hypothetical protein